MTETPTPDSTRREGISARSVRLADGNRWGFALPSVRLKPRVIIVPDEFGRQCEHISVDAAIGHPLEIERLYRTVQAVSGGGVVREQYAAFFSLAVALLRRAHDIGVETACELLEVSASELPYLVRVVISVASGREDPEVADLAGE